MRAEASRIYEMGGRVGSFSDGQPDTDQGHTLSVEKVKELVKHGLSESVLGQFGEMLDRFDAAVLLANTGRTAHKGATKQLDELAAEIASVVRTMDARNRQRFQDNRQLLESWISASTVLGSK